MAISALNRKLLRDLWHLRGQALAIATVIAGGVTTWIISFATIDSLLLTQESFYRENRFAEVFASVKRAPLSVAARVKEIPGVEVVLPRTVGGATLELAGFADPITATLVSLPDQGRSELNRLFLREGRLPAPRSPDEVVVSEPFAEAHDLGLGEDVEAIINGRRKSLTVVGVGLSPEYVYQIRPGELFPDYQRYAILWMRESPLAAAMGMEGAFNDLALTLAPEAQEQGVIDRLDRLLAPYGGVGAYGREDQVSHNYLAQEIAGLEASARTVPVIFLGVAAFLLSVVFTRLVSQQRDQIAVLKAFGYRNRDVGWHYLGLVLLVVALGGLPGVALGAWLGHGLAELYQEFFRFPYLRFHLSPFVVVQGLGVTALAALLGTLGAVRRAVALPPAEAMRPEPPALFRTTLLERLGVQRLLDQPSRMILRNLERRPVKMLLSVLGIALAGAITLVGQFQEDAVDYIVSVQFNLAQREDLTITLIEPTERGALFELASLPGVRLAEPFRVVPVELHAAHRSYRTAIQGFESGARLHRVLDEGLQPIRLPEGGILLSEYIAKSLGIGEGDEVTLQVLEGTRPVRRVIVAGVVREFIGVSAYMSIDGLNRLMQEGPVISGAFLAVNHQQLSEVFDQLKARPRVAGVSQREVALQSFYETMAETLLIFAFINTLLAGSIAFGVVYNSARVTFSEQGRELASLRVLGFTRGEIAYILLGQLAVITLAAIPLGFLIGREFCRIIAESFASELYTIPLVIDPSTYGFSATVLLAATAISALVIRRRLYRLDLVGVLKTRE